MNSSLSKAAKQQPSQQQPAKEERLPPVQGKGKKLSMEEHGGMLKALSPQVLASDGRQKKAQSTQNLDAQRKSSYEKERERLNSSIEKIREHVTESRERELNIQQIKLQKSPAENKQQIICVEEEQKRPGHAKKRSSLGSNFLLVPQKDSSTQNPTCNFTQATSRLNNYDTSLDYEGQESQQIIYGTHLDSQIKFLNNTINGDSHQAQIKEFSNISQRKLNLNNSKMTDARDSKNEEGMQLPSSSAHQSDVQSSHVDYHKKYPINIMKCKRAYNMQV